MTSRGDHSVDSKSVYDLILPVSPGGRTTSKPMYEEHRRTLSKQEY